MGWGIAAPTLRVKGQDGLDGHVDAAKFVALKHDLAHLFSILQRVHRRFREQDLAAAGIDLHLLEEGEVP